MHRRNQIRIPRPQHTVDPPKVRQQHHHLSPRHQHLLRPSQPVRRIQRMLQNLRHQHQLIRSPIRKPLKCLPRKARPRHRPHRPPTPLVQIDHVRPIPQRRQSRRKRPIPRTDIQHPPATARQPFHQLQRDPHIPPLHRRLGCRHGKFRPDRLGFIHVGQFPHPRPRPHKPMPARPIPTPPDFPVLPPSLLHAIHPRRRPAHRTIHPRPTRRSIHPRSILPSHPATTPPSPLVLSYPHSDAVPSIFPHRSAIRSSRQCSLETPVKIWRNGAIILDYKRVIAISPPTTKKSSGRTSPIHLHYIIKS